VGTGDGLADGTDPMTVAGRKAGWALAHSLIDAIKGGGLIFAYYPDQTWLKSSALLN